MVETPEKKPNNISLVVALIIGFVALLSWMTQSLGSVRKTIGEVEKKIGAHGAKGDHPFGVLMQLSQTRAELGAMKERLKALRHEQQDHEKIRGHPPLRSEVAQHQEVLRKVESQLAWVSDALGVQIRATDRLVRLLWQQVYGVPLPGEMVAPLRRLGKDAPE